MGMKPILAFMENMWLQPKSKDSFDRSYFRIKNEHGAIAAEEYRLKIIEYALFAGCVTGKRLKAAFGPKLIELIVWEESTRHIGTYPKQKFSADLTHMRKAIAHHRPRIIVTFGNTAGDALAAVWHGASERCIHPAARGSHIISELNQTGRRLADYIALTK